MVSHVDALDLLLAHTCGDGTDEQGITSFNVNLHCHDATIKAKLVSERGQYPIRYEVIGVTVTGSSSKKCSCPTCSESQ